METKVKKKTGPRPMPAKDKLSSIIAFRVNHTTKHIYRSLADNLGLSETDLFYYLMNACRFMDHIYPMIEETCYEPGTKKVKEESLLFLAQYKIIMKGLSLISDLDDKECKWVRGKRVKRDPTEIVDHGTFLVDDLEKRFHPNKNL